MAVVRIEVDFDVPLEGGVESAGTARVELDSPIDPRKLLKQANEAIQKLLPEPAYRPPSTIIQLNNVRFTEVDQETLFGRVVAPPPTRVEPGSTLGQCQDRCPHDEAGHPPQRCGRALGHEGQHYGDDGCAWFEDPERCNELLEFGSCPKPKGHAGQHVDNDRCSHCCPEDHGTPAQCTLRKDHTGSHRSRIADGNCHWSDARCPERVHWLGVGYPCIEEEDHEGPCESATGIRWQFGNSIVW